MPGQPLGVIVDIALVVVEDHFPDQFPDRFPDHVWVIVEDSVVEPLQLDDVDVLGPTEGEDDSEVELIPEFPEKDVVEL